MTSANVMTGSLLGQLLNFTEKNIIILSYADAVVCQIRDYTVFHT